AGTFVHDGAGRGRAAEEERVELGADDPPARDVGPRRLVLALAVGDRRARHPAGAELDARERRRVEHRDARAGRREPPRGRAAAGTAPDDYDVDVRHTRKSPASTARRVRRGTRIRSIAFAASMAAKMSPSMSMSPAMNASPKRSGDGRRRSRRKTGRERNTTANPPSPGAPTRVLVPSQRRNASGVSTPANACSSSPTAVVTRRSGGAGGM